MKQQTKDFKDFTISRGQYKCECYKAKHTPTMDLYFREHRTTTIVFNKDDIEIIQNEKELTFTMDAIIKKSLDFLKTNFPKYEYIDNLNVRKELRDNYDETRS